MSKSKNIIIAFSKSEPERGIETCVHCGTKYDKNEEHKPAKGYCPNCGGMTTEEMGYPKSTIGMVYDTYRNQYFKKEKAKQNS